MTNSYKISDSAPLTDADACRVLFGYDPRVTYNPGAEVVRDHGGGLQFVGYPRATWTFAVLSIEHWEDLLDLVGGYSGEVYVETRNDVDNWLTYRAIARLPEPRTLNRWGGYYRDVTIELILIEVQT